MREVVKRDENEWSKEMSCGNCLLQRHQSSHTDKWVVKGKEMSGQKRWKRVVKRDANEWSKEMSCGNRLPQRHQSSHAKRWVVKRDEMNGQKRWKRVVRRDELWKSSSTKTSIVSHNEMSGQKRWNEWSKKMNTGNLLLQRDQSSPTKRWDMCSFPQQSPVIRGSFAKYDLHLKAFCGSLPPCKWHMGWLWLVGSIKLQVSFAKEP